MAIHAFKTPILFLAFNRPEVTKRVFASISEARPRRLYVAADGPRQEKQGESEKCDEVRRIATAVDWDCDLRTLFRDENLGCRIAVSTAIDWFFQNEEEGIILEDDCMPTQSFFPFCEELLKHYRKDTRVMQICGSYFLSKWSKNSDSYYFSKYGPIWGWASWRRAWHLYDVDMKFWPRMKKERRHYDLFDTGRERRFREKIYDKVFSGEINTWDYQWGLAKMMNSGLSIIPTVNQISNIGFGADATHVQQIGNPFADLPRAEMKFPLHHPKNLDRDADADTAFLTEFILNKGNRVYGRRILSFLRKVMSIK